MVDEASRPLGVAATVVLLRDGAAGLEVLLLERPRSRGSFAGAWVFPGGALDPEDYGAVELDEEDAARRAAVRETREETALEVADNELIPVAVWSPPAQAPKRMRTWFYYAAAPAAGVLTLAADELIDFRWIRPADALDAHSAGKLELIPPTWVTLEGLTKARNSFDALNWAKSTPVEHRHTRIASTRSTLLWEGDVAYLDDTLLDMEGARHRLEISDLPWLYLKS